MQIIDNFINYILIEKGLSKNTSLTYRTDLKTLFKLTSLTDLNFEDLNIWKKNPYLLKIYSIVN